MKMAIAPLCLIVAACGSKSDIVGNGPSAAPSATTAPSAPQAGAFDNDPRVVAWRELDVKCHQLIADPHGARTCAERAQAQRQLERQGLCFGRKGEAEYQYKWHKCGSDSLRSGGSAASR